MGYHSDVKFLAYGPVLEMSAFVQYIRSTIVPNLVAEMNQFYLTPLFVANELAGYQVEVQPCANAEPRMFLCYYASGKFHEEFFGTRLLKKIMAEVDEQRPELTYEYVRVGEEQSDIELASSYEADMYLRVITSIDDDSGVEPTTPAFPPLEESENGPVPQP